MRKTKNYTKTSLPGTSCSATKSCSLMERDKKKPTLIASCSAGGGCYRAMAVALSRPAAFRIRLVLGKPTGGRNVYAFCFARRVARPCRKRYPILAMTRQSLPCGRSPGKKSHGSAIGYRAPCARYKRRLNRDRARAFRSLRKR